MARARGLIAVDKKWDAVLLASPLILIYLKWRGTTQMLTENIVDFRSIGGLSSPQHGTQLTLQIKLESER
jgi:hypothetical protein